MQFPRFRTRRLRHQCFAFVHACDNMECGETCVLNLAFDQGLRHDANDRASGAKRSVGKYAHQAYPATAID